MMIDSKWEEGSGGEPDGSRRLQFTKTASVEFEVKIAMKRISSGRYDVQSSCLFDIVRACRQSDRTSYRQWLTAVSVRETMTYC
jgi:hypothetical protein